MQINPAAAIQAFDSTTSTPSTGGNSGTTSTSSGSSDSDVDTETFISILSAELQAQDPTNPLQPSDFVTQLAQFNSLDELIHIRQDIENGASLTSSSSSSNAGSSSTNSSSGNQDSTTLF